MKKKKIGIIMKKIKKPWGYEELIENDKYVVKKLFMKKDHRCSLQYHEYKKETIYVLSGKLIITIGDEDIVYKKGEYVTIEPNTIHRMTGLTNCYYLESSTTELDDVVRVEDDYKRI